MKFGGIWKSEREILIFCFEFLEKIRGQHHHPSLHLIFATKNTNLLLLFSFPLHCPIICSQNLLILIVTLVRQAPVSISGNDFNLTWNVFTTNFYKIRWQTVKENFVKLQKFCEELSRRKFLFCHFRLIKKINSFSKAENLIWIVTDGLRENWIRSGSGSLKSSLDLSFVLPNLHRLKAYRAMKIIFSNQWRFGESFFVTFLYL